MIELKTQLVLAVVWLLSFTLGKCDVYSNLTKFDECRRLCHEQLGETRVSETAESRCKRKCLLLKANENTTAPPITAKISVNLTKAASGKSPATEGQKNNCPLRYRPGPNEDVPGYVSGLTAAFVQEKKETTQVWVANVSWTAPKDVNASINWRGYLVIWFSLNGAHDKEHLKPANCRLVPKSQTHLVINETDGWKYPRNLYVAVLALPSYEERTELKLFRPRKPDWGSPGQFEPVSIKGRDKKGFQLQSPEGIAILIVAGLLTVLVIIGLVNICVFKRTKSKGYYVEFTSENKKPAEKKKDELKDQLIV